VQITKCGTYRGNGISYVVSTDLPVDTAQCLYFENVNAVQVECNGHEANSIWLLRANDFSIRNCVMHGTSRAGGDLRNFEVSNSSGVTVDNVDIIAEISRFVTVQQSRFSNSRIHNGIFQVVVASGVAVSGNSFTNESGATLIANQSMLTFSGGSGNSAILNTIDGGWSGGGASNGANTGILIGSFGGVPESGLTVRSNTIRNVQNRGIVCVGAPPNSVIEDNSIINTGFGLIFGC
jgi:hypothetical protein